jgi:hypothetical protein
MGASVATTHKEIRCLFGNHMNHTEPELRAENARLREQVKELTQEVDVRKRYGRWCCAAHAEKALAEKLATGTGPWEVVGIATMTPTDTQAVA